MNALSRLAILLASVIVLLGLVVALPGSGATVRTPAKQALQISARGQTVHDLLRAVSGDRMLASIEAQLRLGPRFLGSPGHDAVQQMIAAEVKNSSHKLVMQTWTHTSTDNTGYNMMNVIAQLYPERERRIILATHYDSKRLADKDPLDPTKPVPGANDSASGVAVLLEVAHALASAPLPPNVGVDIVFFDGEEGEVSQGGDYSNWEPLGSTYFAERLHSVYPKAKPESGAVFDMVCDRDLFIEKEYSSMLAAPAQLEAFWREAQKVDSQSFANTLGMHIRDDHTPLNAAGIPSFLVIDYDYPPFHTTKDTTDKCSAESLETVAKSLVRYIYALR